MGGDWYAFGRLYGYSRPLFLGTVFEHCMSTVLVRFFLAVRGDRMKDERG